MKTAALTALLASGVSVTAFPWVAETPGVDSSLFNQRKLHTRQQTGNGPGSAAQCPFNPSHVPAAPVTDKYPYNNAKNGLPGNAKGGYQVPAPGDDAHKFIAPGPNDIRGPCPGLNAAANHGFLSRDGIVTFNELLDAQQNLYNVAFDLATILALVGLTVADGDIVTQKLSIGCDATTRTSFSPVLTGSEPGLDGHNKFEADASLTRNDFFTANGDNYNFNSTLFGQMATTTGGTFDRAGISKFRADRWAQSQAENENFFFGPGSLLLYGAATFLYELFPSNSNGLKPDLATVSSFFGAEQNDDGSWAYVHEKIPPNWTNRVDAYDGLQLTAEFLLMYLENPVLFGGNTAAGHFDTLDFGALIKDGKLSAEASPEDTLCLLYSIVTSGVPSSLNGVVTPTVKTLEFVLTKISPTLKNLGCPIPLT